MSRSIIKNIMILGIIFVAVFIVFLEQAKATCCGCYVEDSYCGGGFSLYCMSYENFDDSDILCWDTHCDDDQSCCEENFCHIWYPEWEGGELGSSKSSPPSNSDRCYIAINQGNTACYCYDTKKDPNGKCHGFNACCKSPGVCMEGKYDGVTNEYRCCESANPTGTTAAAPCDETGDGVVCGTWTCTDPSNPGKWTCVADLPNKYYYMGNYTTPPMSFATVPIRDVGMLYINMSIDTPIDTYVKIIGYHRSTDGTTWNSYSTISAINNLNYILSTPAYGKYFKVSLSLRSMDGTVTPTLKAVTVGTSPRLTTFSQGQTLGQCWPVSVLYNCTSPFTSKYVSGKNIQPGTIKTCDSYSYTVKDTATPPNDITKIADNQTVVSAWLNETEYSEPPKDLPDNYKTITNDSVCAYP